MTYTALAVASVILVIFLELFVIRSGIFRRLSYFLAYAIVLGFQLLTNSYLTGFGIVQYLPSAILGVRIANAPVEDLLFGFSLVTLMMAIWVRLDSKAAKIEK